MTKGFTKMYAIDFDTWNNSATVKANTPKSEGGLSFPCGVYTSCRPDANLNFVWAIIEHDGLTDLPVVSESEAIAQGMIDNSVISE